MQVTVGITTLANEQLEKTPSEIANAILIACGGDVEKDMVNVTITATAGTVTQPPMPGGAEQAPPPERRIIE